jgi:hypothetical protein
MLGFAGPQRRASAKPGATRENVRKKPRGRAVPVARSKVSSHPVVQRKPETSERGDALEREGDVQTLRITGGTPLGHDLRSFFEPRFGRDLGAVRVHSDTQASELSTSIRARAFTMGNHIAFKRGEFAPQTFRGKELLAHELTHVVQQGGGDRARAPSVQRQTEPAAPPPPPQPGELLCNGVRRDVEFPTCDRVNPRPTGAPPSRERFAANTTLNQIRAEAPGSNTTLISRGRRSSGEAVQLVQQAILSFGCRTRERNFFPNDGADGVFGPETERAVRKFQCQAGLRPDGIVGPITLRRLDAFVGSAPPFILPPGFDDLDQICPVLDCPITPEQPRFPSPPDAVSSPIPQLRDPGVPSGALCRGACGADCPASCRALPDVVLFVTADRGRCFQQCTYQRVQSCYTHNACREHDRCYDNCVINEGERGLCGILTGANPCHCDCDAGCIRTMGGGPGALSTCVRQFALGNRSGPTDGEFIFSNRPIQGTAGPQCAGPRCVDMNGTDVPRFPR